MASKLQQLQSKACQASQFIGKHGNSYYKQLLENNKQYIQEPPTVEKCDQLAKQLFYTRLASISSRNESFWKELDYVKSLWKNRQDLKVEDAEDAEGEESLTSTPNPVSYISTNFTMASNYISRAAAAFTLLSLLVAVHCFDEDGTCSKTCIAEQCDNVGIRYGKYCGKGYWGCPGEAACDDLDVCCMGHDDCVDRFGMTHVKCHVRLKNCLTRVVRSGKVGFSKECPVSRAAPTMIRGMDLAIFLSKLSNTIPHDDLLTNKFV